MTQLILNNTMIEIKKEIEEKGFFRLTSLATNKQRKTTKRMYDFGTITTANNCIAGTYIDFVANWR